MYLQQEFSVRTQAGCPQQPHVHSSHTATATAASSHQPQAATHHHTAAVYPLHCCPVPQRSAAVPNKQEQGPATARPGVLGAALLRFCGCCPCLLVGLRAHYGGRAW
jgi:hypothetical protein